MEGNKTRLSDIFFFNKGSKRNFNIIFFIILIFFQSLKSYGVPIDTLKLFYRVNGHLLNERNQKALDSLNGLLKKYKNVSVKGYGDNLGNKQINKKLSELRANAVSTYLLKADRSLRMIVSGDGQILSSEDRKYYGNPQNRRVDIIFTNSIVKKVLKEGNIGSHNNIDSIKFTKKSDSLAIMDKGGRLSIDELTFLPGRHILDTASNLYLRILTRYLAIHKNIVFEIRGHVCCTSEFSDGWDPDAMDQHLSQNRAKEIYFHFLNNGIDPKRMTFTGVGGAEPKVSPEITSQDEQLNRRVEIIILSK